MSRKMTTSKKESKQIPHVNSKGVQNHYTVDIKIKRAKEELDHDPDKGQNFLIETDQGGVLDNHMFDYGNAPAAARIFGNLINPIG